MNTDDILNERQKTHGEFSTHAFVTQEIKRVMQETDKWETLDDSQKESLEMIAHKIGRILNGNAYYQDHWDDIAGYARLVSRQYD